LGGQLLCAGEFFVGGWCDAGLSGDGEFEAVAMFGDCPDGVAANGLSEADDGVGEVCLADVHGGPERLDQLLFGDEMFGFANEAEESVEGFGLEGNRKAGFFEETFVWVKFKVAESVGGVGRALIFL